MTHVSEIGHCATASASRDARSNLGAIRTHFFAASLNSYRSCDILRSGMELAVPAFGRTKL
jgi:hypothetical protein